MHSSEHLGPNQGSSVNNRSLSVHGFYDYSLAPGDALDCLSSTLLSIRKGTSSLGELPLSHYVQ